MEPTAAPNHGVETPVGVVSVRYWASARSAAGVPGDQIQVPGPVSLAELRRLAVDLHPGRLESVLAVCSVLLGDRPVAAQDPAEVEVRPGDTVEFLPPFAGG
jgi:molybdopterin synthase sulfur carrier subunit